MTGCGVPAAADRDDALVAHDGGDDLLRHIGQTIACQASAASGWYPPRGAHRSIGREDRSRGKQAVPAFYLMKGAPRPPTAAWETAKSSGIAMGFDPETRLELGYFYSEYLGIHDSYVRRLVFTEQEILPRLGGGAAAFYAADGKLQPQFEVHMDLLARFNEDLRRLNLEARRLRVKLESQAQSGKDK